MKSWSCSDAQELRRQRGRLVALVEKIDEKNLGKQIRDTKLLKRRKNRVLKNNGRGRPALKQDPPSQEDEARRLQYTAEIALLEEMLGSDFDSTDDMLHWLSERKKQGAELAQDDPAGWRIQDRKIDRLLGQFGMKPVSVSPGRKPWNKNLVRERITILRDFKRAQISVYARLPVRTLAEQDEQDRERASYAVLDRFCTSNHLETAEIFLRRAGLIRMDVVAPKDANDPECYKAAWRKAVDSLIAELKSSFEML
ncbi:MAG TPA: hypothetical protein VGT78_14720 [Rhizomicrobium sp.]|nr:hypothetical protein [Rhizomicrobium sp.]